MDVSKRLQQVAAACTWLMLALAMGGVLAIGPHISAVLTVNQAALLGALGVAALGAAVITAVSVIELSKPALQPAGVVADIGRLVYLGGVTGAIIAAHGVQTPVWLLFLPVLLTTAFVDTLWKALSYALLASALTLAATGVSHELSKTTVVALLLVVPALPVVTWFTSAVAPPPPARGRRRQNGFVRLGGVEQLRGAHPCQPRAPGGGPRGDPPRTRPSFR